MNQKFEGWEAVALELQKNADDYDLNGSQSNNSIARLNEGQRASLRAIATRIPANGVVIADEVGMGKTRIAVDLAKCVTGCGGRVAIVVPPGLGNQWQTELRDGGLADVPAILRSLHAYLGAWDGDELKPWFDESVIVVSHTFANWRLGAKSEVWRWALVPELYAQWRQLRGQRSPRGYQDGKNLKGRRLCRRVAGSIIKALPTGTRHPFAKQLDELVDRNSGVNWPRHLNRSEYANDGVLRDYLEGCVGMGMGLFDLVIVDEAHKSRSSDSMLSCLINNIIWSTPKLSRRILMTATPVELSVTQWKETFSRLGLDKSTLDKVDEVSSQYVDALKRLRPTWRTSEESRDAFFKTAANFQSTLSPYLLRRDKREDADIIRFKEFSGLGIHEYRQQIPKTVNTQALPEIWRKAVCAAEALSIVSQQADGYLSKRMRLTLGNGHGIAKFLDENQRSDVEDIKQEADDQTRDGVLKSRDRTAQLDAKRGQRSEWWMKTISQSFPDGEDSLLNHPAIMKCVEVIEECTRRGEKVLVFGRFTRPMRTLVNLLNAREMLRCLDDSLDLPHGSRVWPQASIGDNEDHSQWWAAIVCAHEQLKSQLTLEQAAFNSYLSAAYARDDRSRQSFRTSLVRNIELGLVEMKDAGSYAKKLFLEFARSASSEASSASNALALVAKSIGDWVGSTEDATPLDCAQAFCHIVAAMSDRDCADVDTDLDEVDAEAEWSTIRDRLLDEKSRTRGGFARLMFGQTGQESRQMIRLAFNRPQAFPYVLVAQSMVGREGLNLHEACRTVVLMHPEWNPGVVEQQIGRVDRVNSQWCRELNQAIGLGKSAEELPRIKIHPIIFRGTYDEWNWQVLQARWDNL